LANEFLVDICDEYVCLVENVAMESLKKFVLAIQKTCDNQYLHKTTNEHIIKKWKWMGREVGQICLNCFIACILITRIAPEHSTYSQFIKKRW